MNTTAARTALFRLLDTWRAEPGPPVYIGPYGAAEAVLAPLAVWHRMLALIADSWDAQTAAIRVTRLKDPTGPRPAELDVGVGQADAACVLGVLDGEAAVAVALRLRLRLDCVTDLRKRSAERPRWTVVSLL